MLKTYWKWLKTTWSGLFILSLWNKDMLLACCFQQLSWERFSFFMVHRTIYLRDNIVWSLVCLKFEFYFILFPYRSLFLDLARGEADKKVFFPSTHFNLLFVFLFYSVQWFRINLWTGTKTYLIICKILNLWLSSCIFLHAIGSFKKCFYKSACSHLWEENTAVFC